MTKSFPLYSSLHSEGLIRSYENFFFFFNISVDEVS